VFAGGAEADVGPALFGELQVDAGGGDVSEIAGAIDGQVVEGLLLEILQHLRIVTFDPAGGGDVDRFKGAVDLVLILEAVGHHVELQDTNRAEDQIVVAQRTEQLGRALFGVLRKVEERGR